jgi:hypothetical protein
VRHVIRRSVRSSYRQQQQRTTPQNEGQSWHAKLAISRARDADATLYRVAIEPERTAETVAEIKAAIAPRSHDNTRTGRFWSLSQNWKSVLRMSEAGSESPRSREPD